MATWSVSFYPFNLLELSTVTVQGDPDYGFPLSRIYDRAISLYYRDTATGTKWFKADQASQGIAIDTAFIIGHNFDGIYIALQYSSDDFGSDINSAVPNWTQSGNADIVKNISSPITSQFWRLTLNTSITNPRLAEFYLSKAYSFNCLREDNPTGQDQGNVQWNATTGGVERSTKIGPKRRVRNYTFFLDETEFASLQTVIGYLDDYSLPFFFKDHAGNYFSARFADPPSFDFNHATHTRVNVSIIEML